MIINDELKFAFVHIQKTGGVSIRNALSCFNNKEHLQYHSFVKFANIPEDYFKFAFVRNPWERLVSWYNMILKKGVHNKWSQYVLENSNSFEEFLNLTETIFESNSIDEPKSILNNQLDYITFNDKIAVDFIGRFDFLQDDFNLICKNIGIESIVVPHSNKTEYPNYRSYYNSKLVEKVKEMYKKDIEYFNYEF
jgi:chondroitin 4-sulfotransferase 11